MEPQTQWLPPAPAPPAPEPAAAPPPPWQEQRKPLLQRMLGPLLVAGALLLKFGKVGLLLLTKAKFLTTSASMLVSVAAYALIWGWKFAAGFVALLFIHEMGHYIQLRREGVKPSGMVFIPFLGAAVGDALARRLGARRGARRPGRADPRLARLPRPRRACGWRPARSSGRRSRSPASSSTSSTSCPVVPFDGGRAMAAMAPWMWFVGLGAMLALLLVAPNPFVILFLLLGVFTTWQRWKRRKAGEEGNAAYYRVKPAHRLRGRRGLRGADRAARRRHGRDAPRAHVQRRVARSISRFSSRSLIARRLSPTSLPLASAISTLACEPLK